MKKIISLFQRNYETDRLVRDEVVPGAEWVLAGEGIATEKYDGTACLVSGGVLWKRYDAKRGKTPPAGFIAAQDPDLITGHHPGWVPVGDGSEDRWHREAWEYEQTHKDLSGGGTYELVGPKVQGNPYHLTRHELWGHGDVHFEGAPRDFAGLRDFFLSPWPAVGAVEGIVFHHPDGRMVKVKANDFKKGLWPPRG